MPLLMDLSCPIEFRGTEVTRDSAGHAQAYLTFFNLGEKRVEGLRAMVTMEDRDGQSLGIRPLCYRGIHAPGRCQFTLCMAAEHLPFFENARVLIYEVWLEGDETFRLDEDALLDCTVYEAPPGEYRAALIGIAGEDAVCYAAAKTGVWICLCGRYNENGRSSCIRCGRSRREVFALTPDRALERYRELKRRESEAFEEGRIDARTQARQVRQRRYKDYIARVKAEHRRTLLMGGIMAAALLAIAWLIFFL